MIKMEKCLKNNKICSLQNQNCKTCKLDNCRNTINICEEVEIYNEKSKKEIIKLQLPEQCKRCSFLEVINANKEIVRCPYMIKEKCILK